MRTIQLSVIAILCLGVQRSSLKILQRQKRDWIIDSLEIDEGYKGPFPYSLGFIKLADQVRAFNLHGQGVELDPKGLLSIDEDTGEITVHYAVDYEEYPVLKLTFEAMILGTKRVDTRLGVEVQIIDANDNAPTFNPQTVEVSILESTKQGTHLVTLMVSDKDAETDNNNKFSMKMVSVTPKPQDLEFYLEQRGEIGMISFKGCLDNEIAEKYTIIVEAKDRGETVQLSSSATVTITVQDGNNHIPEFLGTTQTKGSVKETVGDVLVCRVQADDKDTRGTAAWKAKYQIHGDTDNNFQIETDPETNDGLLYVKKPLDYEVTPLVNLTLTVDNEIPYYFCKVIKRTATTLWQVSGKRAGATAQGSASSQSMSVMVSVEDVNEAPVFDERIKQSKVAENGEKGTHLAKFTAKDPDIMQPNSFVFMKGFDPAGWVTVDQKTGEVTTTTSLDRESPYVKDGIYNVTVLVVDNGSPSMTGTATLTIHVADENDNSPTLGINKIDMCQTDGASVANISVTDLDGEPYAGPFSFKVLGDVQGKWTVHPQQGYFVNLVKENTVVSGVHDLLLEIADRQHITSVHNLSVTVCACHNPAIPNCSQRSTSGSTAGGAAIGIVLAGLLLLAAALCAILVTCKKNIAQFPEETSSYLIESNSESPGTDCKVTSRQLVQKSSENGGTFHTIVKNQAVSGFIGESSTLKTGNSSFMRANMQQNQFIGDSSTLNTGNSSFMRANMQQNQGMGALSTLNTGYQEGQCLGVHHFGSGTHETFGASSAFNVEQQNKCLQKKFYQSWMGERKYSAACKANTMEAHRQFLIQMLNKKLHSLQAAGEELGDYDPHVYADEETAETFYELDTIPLPEISFDPNMDLDSRFHDLALIGMTHQSAKTTVVHKTSEVVSENYHL